jgi:hypothetical protein
MTLGFRVLGRSEAPCRWLEALLGLHVAVFWVPCLPPAGIQAPANSQQGMVLSFIPARLGFVLCPFRVMGDPAHFAVGLRPFWGYMLLSGGCLVYRCPGSKPQQACSKALCCRLSHLAWTFLALYNLSGIFFGLEVSQWGRQPWATFHVHGRSAALRLVPLPRAWAIRLTLPLA